MDLSDWKDTEKGLPCDWNIAGGAEVEPGLIRKRPEAGSGAEDSDTDPAASPVIAGNRQIGGISEIAAGYPPERPETGGRPEDTDVIDSVSVEIAGHRFIIR